MSRCTSAFSPAPIMGTTHSISIPMSLLLIVLSMHRTLPRRYAGRQADSEGAQSRVSQAAKLMRVTRYSALELRRADEIQELSDACKSSRTQPSLASTAYGTIEAGTVHSAALS